MEGVRVSRGAATKLGRVDGDLRVEDHAVIQSLDASGVVVAGAARFDGSAEVECDLECGSLKSTDGMLRVSGGLLVHGDVEVEDALYTRGNLKARRIDVGGKLSVGISLEAESADVGGSLAVQGNAQADDVDVGGSFEVLGETKVRRLDVGGRVEIGGGEVSEKADVGGTLMSRKPLKFGEISSGGTIALAGGEGQVVEVGGRLESRGDLKCRKTEVGGIIEIAGSFTGDEIEVGGRLAVSGDLRLSGELEVGGIAEIGGTITASEIEIGGRLTATKGVVAEKAEVGGRVETKEGFKAGEFDLGNGASCTGVLVGGSVHIGVGARTQDVYCISLEVERGARLGHVFADAVELGSDCSVDSLTYTRELRGGDRLRFGAPPQRADKLPPFPL